MTAKKTKTVNVDKNNYRIYRKKAEEFYQTMVKAKDTGLWEAVGLNAVHCAISCCDAMSTLHLGVRSAGEDHNQVIDLLSKIPKIKSSKEGSTVRRIIAKKNLIAYECREFRQKEADDIFKLTERFYLWMLSNLPKA